MLSGLSGFWVGLEFRFEGLGFKFRVWVHSGLQDSFGTECVQKAACRRLNSYSQPQLIRPGPFEPLLSRFCSSELGFRV